MKSYLTEAQHSIRAKVETGTNTIGLRLDLCSIGIQIFVIFVCKTRQATFVDDPLLAYDPPIRSSGAEKGMK